MNKRATLLKELFPISAGSEGNRLAKALSSYLMANPLDDVSVKLSVIDILHALSLMETEGVDAAIEALTPKPTRPEPKNRLDGIEINIFASSDRMFEQFKPAIPELKHINELLELEENQDVGVDDIPYLRTGLMPELGEHKVFITAWKPMRPEMVGAIVLRYGTEEDTMCKGEHWVSSIGTHPDYEGNGVTRELATAVFRFCRFTGTEKIAQSSYTVKGEVLMGMFDRLSSEYPDVDFVDHKIRL